MKNLILIILITISIIFTAGCIAEEAAIDAGYAHITRRGDARAEMVYFIESASNGELSVQADEGLRGIQKYLDLSIASNQIQGGVLFTQGHSEVYQSFKELKPYTKAFPERFPVRNEFLELVCPDNKIQLVWVDAIVIIYNPDLINREDVPKTWAEFSEFEQGVVFPTRGSMSTWSVVGLYYHLGEEKFTTLLNNTVLRYRLPPAMATIERGGASVGLSHILDPYVQEGKVGVIWPEDGAIARPAFMVVPKNPTEYQLRLADLLMSQEAAEFYANEFNVASILPNGPVPTIVKENNFNFIFIPHNEIICDENIQQVNRILNI